MSTKIVLHADKLERLPELFGNLNNLVRHQQEHSQESIEITVLLNGDAIMGYLIPTHVTQIEKLLATGLPIAFHACNNSLNRHGIKSDQLPAGVKVVPAGVLDLAQLQQAGFAYVKP